MRQSRSLRIFVFDDDPAITRLLQLVLSAKGYDIQTFADPSFCHLYQKQHCECPADSSCADVIITDIMMPHMNGIDLLRMQREKGCKALAANKALLSAKNDAVLKDAVKELGCHFIRKPFRLDDICDWVEMCAERQAPNSPGQPWPSREHRLTDR